MCTVNLTVFDVDCHVFSQCVFMGSMYLNKVLSLGESHPPKT